MKPQISHPVYWQYACVCSLVAGAHYQGTSHWYATNTTTGVVMKSQRQCDHADTHVCTVTQTHTDTQAVVTSSAAQVIQAKQIIHMQCNTTEKH